MLNGKKLQYLRRLKGLTQVYIAECIGISERWVGKIENENATPSQEVYEKWLLTLYGKLKPIKQDESKQTKTTNKKKTRSKEK